MTNQSAARAIITSERCVRLIMARSSFADERNSITISFNGTVLCYLDYVTHLGHILTWDLSDHNYGYYPCY